MSLRERKLEHRLNVALNMKEAAEKQLPICQKTCEKERKEIQSMSCRLMARATWADYPELAPLRQWRHG
ncbi:hypothetical protein U1Q18_014835 [Sarracenia purpurea var. burkii]